MLDKLLQDRIQITQQIRAAVLLQLQKLSNATGITVDMGMGSITFEKGEVVIYYADVFNEKTLGRNPRIPQPVEGFLGWFNNPYASKEALLDENESAFEFNETKKQVAEHFYSLVCQLDIHYHRQEYPVLWDICGPCRIEPQKSWFYLKNCLKWI